MVNNKKKKELSQAQVWYDKALLQSWDEALEEYKACCPHKFNGKNELIVIHSFITAFMHVENESKMSLGQLRWQKLNRTEPSLAAW